MGDSSATPPDRYAPYKRRAVSARGGRIRQRLERFLDAARRVRTIALPMLAACALCGCGTLPSGRGWGESATIAPGRERVGAAAKGAALDPWVWAPLLGAAAFQIDNFDRRVVDWASDHTPVFGSQHNAERWSDDLRSASAYAHYLTIVATPSGPEAGEWMLDKAKGTIVQAVAVGATGGITQALKSGVDRTRPDESEDESFPSGHSALSAVHTRLASRNLRAIPLTDRTRLTLDAALYALTIGTSWARIEADKHFPSDTLAGMALGNFMGAFVNDAFLGVEAPISVSIGPGHALVQWRSSF